MGPHATWNNVHHVKFRNEIALFLVVLALEWESGFGQTSQSQVPKDTEGCAATVSDTTLRVDRRPDIGGPHDLLMDLGRCDRCRIGEREDPQSSVVLQASTFAGPRRLLAHAENSAARRCLSEVDEDLFTNSAKETWGTVKWISGTTAVAAGIAAVYFKSEADKNYESYRQAVNSSEAAYYRDKTQHSNSLKEVAIGIAVTGTVTALVAWIVELSY